MTAASSREPARTPHAQSAGSRTTLTPRAATCLAIGLIAGGTTLGTHGDPACVFAALSLMPFLTRPRTRKTTP